MLDFVRVEGLKTGENGIWCRTRVVRLMYDCYMRIICLIFTVVVTLAKAEPPRTTEDMERSLSDQGLPEQVQQYRQRIGQNTSAVVIKSMSFLGVPYLRGGNSAQNGFDCSGFVRAVFEQTFGSVLPRRAKDQASFTQKIERHELQPGDLVFFNTMRQKFSHVGIYLGDNKFIHSPWTGEKVKVEDMRQAYWAQRFTGARQVQDLKTGI